MNFLLINMVACLTLFVFSVVFLFFFFDGIDQHAAEYQECGGKYCAQDETK